jgi:DNA (cytosine-5)-methyltransferase 1
MEEKALDPAPIWSDLRTFDGKPWRGVVDLITGGYPCQPFSSAGKRLGEDDPRHLWPEIRRITEEIEPRFVFFENVAGHLTLGLSDVLRDLQEMGFRCSTGLFTASEVGASHRRERLFILGMVNTDSTRQDETGIRHEIETGKQSLERCRELADADIDSSRSAYIDSRITEKRSKESDDNGCYRKLADPMLDGSQRIDEDRTAKRSVERSSGSERDIPIFPPGPNNLDAWRDILSIDANLSPAIEPDLRRMDDGMAARMDRLRACGNGVVPLVAAYAFTTLLSCIEDDK